MIDSVSEPVRLAPEDAASPYPHFMVEFKPPVEGDPEGAVNATITTQGIFNNDDNRDLLAELFITLLRDI